MIRKIEENLKKLLPKDNSEPLAIRRAVCDELGGELVALGEGRKIFPYDQVMVELYASDDKQQLIYESSFLDGRQLESSVREHLQQEGCSMTDNVRLEINIVREHPSDWGRRNFKLNYSRDTVQSDKSDLARPSARLIVLSGKAKIKTYRIKKAQTYIGRMEEVIDKHGFPVRRNDVVFLDTEDELNSTVSRTHACLEYDERRRDFFLRDTESRHGTRIERHTQMIEVNGPQAVRLRDGDKLFFGRACIQFSIEPEVKS
jgi:hypothetical protein